MLYIQNTIEKTMANRDIFSGFYKQQQESPQSNEGFTLNFIHKKEPSFRQLNQLLGFQDEDKTVEEADKGSEKFDQNTQETFEAEIETELKRLTSFESDFMENHRHVLRNSILRFQISSQKQSDESEDLKFPSSDIQNTIFSKELFSEFQIKENQDLFKSNVDEYRILKEAVSSLNDLPEVYVKDVIQIVCFVLKRIAPLSQTLKKFNSFEVGQVQEVVEDFTHFVNSKATIQVFKRQNLNEKGQSSQSIKEANDRFESLAQTWIYTILIAKLGYFENDSFDNNSTLVSHLIDLTTLKKRESSLLEFLDLDNEELFSAEVPRKKIKP